MTPCRKQKENLKGNIDSQEGWGRGSSQAKKRQSGTCRVYVTSRKRTSPHHPFQRIRSLMGFNCQIKSTINNQIRDSSGRTNKKKTGG
ncbi:hypothetical protein C922_05836 [Plasmodium inui San Antonio 1]|uniref:Uncharacterized protein n=1 Tax=Plasmodium inui San Antonio 1 TaxID=1237626 RepID=W6ZWW0_9APIC|nr:hypothetical protein C922_05836 [Plasmodium inui San Antonio 1]EUD63783.1 hypothetical protein C922_05836 [Plasmodium inui San Antonio 1]